MKAKDIFKNEVVSLDEKMMQVAVIHLHKALQNINAAFSCLGDKHFIN